MFDVVTADLQDAAAAPLLAGLQQEYTSRYGHLASREFEHPQGHFTAEQGGALLLILDEGRTVAGGALRRFDPAYVAPNVLGPDFSGEHTTEFKRIWTDSGYRRRGLGRRVLRELEQQAADFGYRRVFLTTGPSQPEAVGLYQAAGYTELPDFGAEARGFAVHPFVKTLS